MGSLLFPLEYVLENGQKNDLKRKKNFNLMLVFCLFFCVVHAFNLYLSLSTNLIHPVAATVRVASFLLYLKVLSQILPSPHVTLAQS